MRIGGGGGGGGGGILLTSVIHTGARQEFRLPHSQSVQQSLLHSTLDGATVAAAAAAAPSPSVANKLSLPIPAYMSRSVTCSTLQTDI